MFNKLFRRLLIAALIFLTAPLPTGAQVIGKKIYNELVSLIKTELSHPLNEETEEGWISAFNAINLVKYETPAVVNRISYAAKHMQGRSVEFKKMLISLLNSDFPGKYADAVKPVFFSADEDDRLLAMAANYLLHSASPSLVSSMQQKVFQKLQEDTGNAVLHELNEQLLNANKKISVPSMHPFFEPGYLPGQVIVFSIQRPNRNFPGIAIIRKADGSFLKNADGSLFAVGQLTRSGSNMPGYISLGNTPQGIFRMDKFDTSKSTFSGPSTNIQLTLPFENKASHFYQDNSLSDSVWTLEQYLTLLPEKLRHYKPLYGTFYAGKAGRNEIIAHGSTVDPQFFKGRPYYPYTPSEGCLVTKEFWKGSSGLLLSSDQLKLTEAVRKAGGPYGYLIVLETADKKAPVSVKEILEWL